jgi:hypothetical protein
MPVLLWIGLLTVTGLAHASSRLVLQLTEPAVVLLDGAPVNHAMAGNRVVQNGLNPGIHLLEFKDLQGKSLYSTRIELLDGGEMTARFSATGGLIITGGGQIAAAAPTAASGTAPSGDPAAAMDAREQRPPGEADTSSFDYNGGGKGGAAPGAAPKYAGNPDGFGKTVGTAARVGVGVAAPTAALVGGTVVPAAVHGTRNTLENAQAGGLDAFRGSSGFKQGRPTPPKAITSQVEFISTDNEPLLIFLEGFLIAQVGGKQGNKKSVTLEVGRHLIEVWDGETSKPIHKGVALVEQGVKLQIQVSEASPPIAPDRSWCWSPRD